MVEKMAGNLSHSVVPGRKCYSVRSSNYDTPRPLRFDLLFERRHRTERERANRRRPVLNTRNRATLKR
jgi:hypothetical protein